MKKEAVIKQLESLREHSCEMNRYDEKFDVEDSIWKRDIDALDFALKVIKKLELEKEKIMTKEEIIRQLENIRDFSITSLCNYNKDFLDKDIAALDYAINFIKKQEPRIYKLEPEVGTPIKLKADSFEEAEEIYEALKEIRAIALESKKKKREEMIEQLEKIRDYSIVFLFKYDKDFLEKDIEALEYAINVIKETGAKDL